MSAATQGGMEPVDGASVAARDGIATNPGGGRPVLDLVFRHRYALHTVVYALGFWAPWNSALHLDGKGLSTWLLLAGWPARHGWMSFTASTISLLSLGIAFTFLGALLRTWGTAYLSSTVVLDVALHGGRVLAEGPFRHVRNPLYLGTMLHTVGLALLMPPSGALFVVMMIPALQFALIAAEESFLEATRGSEYVEYKASVPRIVPSLTARVVAGGVPARWLDAALGELYMWGVFVSFAVLGCRYNAFVVTQGVVISFGASLVARAFLRGRRRV